MTYKTCHTCKYIAMYLSAIVMANFSVSIFGPKSSIINAFLFIGLDLTTRDYLHSHWNGKNLFRNMALLIFSGSVISYAINSDLGTIAIASFVAFSLAGVIDSLTFHVLGKHNRFTRVNGSNILAAGVDSFVFPLIAFGGILWPIVIGQFIAKVAGGLIWFYILRGNNK